ncbi:protein FAR1-RELATED SEQUENCE 5-like [Argentina anserina]|uniref:protein FAR1-RELATED SEQUENCE 5-like n=1 Tax=Argentina anserina TaxID=57926 RepID=UPI00217647EB|nr:protein FAR1-RELATED SEQUENCE 5-like [Potentilla anserina]XP_050368422.1 protein FAR1-RELATED SEQUENCE 5-like [Potentilla anserina]
MDLNTEEGSNTDNSDEEIEYTNLIEEAELQDCTRYRGKLYKDLTLEDLKGVEFNSIEEVDNFYIYYSLAKGFSVRKYKLDKNRSGTQVIRRKLVCSKEGKRKSARKDTISHQQGSKGKHDNSQHCQQELMVISGQNPHKKQCTYTRRTTRMNCPASFTVRLCTKRGVYYASEFITEHNHALAAHRQSQSLHLRKHDVTQVNASRKVSVRTCDAYEFLVHPVRGYEFVRLYNKPQGERKEVVMDGDVQSLVTWMNLKAMGDPHFYCIFSVDKEGRLANLFWRDGQSLMDYNAFGEVLIFDSSEKCNMYGKTLAVFVGCNNHRATVLFGCALLVDGTEETYDWVITSFLTSMHGKKPTSVIINSDAIFNVVTKFIPEARHRLCAWHVGKNGFQHLKDVDTLRHFYYLIFAGLTVEEWARAWQYFVTLNCLEHNEWVTDMYHKRERWGEAFFRDHFFGAICSTQRCEEIHRNLEEGIDLYMNMYEVLPRVEKAIERIRNRVLQDGYRSQNYSPVCGNHMRCLQEEISKKFTRDIFLLIQEQINFESNFVIGQRGVHPKTGASLISLMQYGKPDHMWTVSYQSDESNPTFVCSCKLFESDGIPCCHIFAVMKFEMLTTFPESLVNKRWTKEATVKRTLPSSGLVSNMSVQITRYGELMAECAKICHISSYSEEGYNETKEALSQLKIRSQKYWGGNEFQDSVLSHNQPMNLTHHPEEARAFEFFAGYEKSKNAALGSKISGLPDFFQYFRPFPNV